MPEDGAREEPLGDWLQVVREEARVMGAAEVGLLGAVTELTAWWFFGRVQLLAFLIT